MNWTLILGLWRQRLSSPIRMVILILWMLVPPGLMSAVRGLGLSALGDGYPITMVFAVGMIGQDVSSGVLQLLFARPVRRSEYVLNRWLAVAIGASLVSLTQVLLAWGLTAAKQTAPEPQTIAMFLAGRELEIIGAAATMALLSSLIGGLGDLAVFILLMLTGGMVGMIGQFQRSQVVIGIGHEISALVSPRLDIAQIAAGSPPWFAIATYASNLALCLLLAMMVMNRKEVSYASS